MQPRRQQVLVAVCGVAALVYGLLSIGQTEARRDRHVRSRLQTSWYEVLDVGDPFPNLEFGAGGERIGLAELAAGKWRFFVISSEIDEGLLDYEKVLLEVYPELRFIHIVSPTENPEHEGHDHGEGIALPSGVLRVLDEGGAVRAVLGVPASLDFSWTVMVDPEAVVRFSSPRNLSADTLRQLSERYLAGGVSDRLEKRVPGYQPGAPIPKARLLEVRSGVAVRLEELDLRSAQLVFFRANCTSCELGFHLRTLKSLAEVGVDFRDGPYRLVFSKSFASQDFSRLASDAEFAGPVYVAQDFIPDWEDPYNTIPSGANRPVLIGFDSDSKVAAVSDYQNWVRQALGGKP